MGLGGCPHAAVRSPPPQPRSRFLYSDEVQIGPETVMTTLYTAKKYAVPALEAHCVEFLKKNLRADNAFMLLTQVRDGGCRCAGAGRGHRGRGEQGCGAGRGRETRWGAGAPGLRKDAGAWVRVRTPGQGRTDGGISEFRRRLTLAPGCLPHFILPLSLPLVAPRCFPGRLSCSAPCWQAGLTTVIY